MRLMMFAVTAVAALAATVPAVAAPGDEAKLKAIEVQWGKALLKGDTATIATFTAPEWVLQSDGPAPETRAESLKSLASGKSKFTSYTVRDMRVTVMGDVAFVIGYDDEKSSYDGHDTSGTYSFMDVFQRRGGKWQALATHVSKVTH